MAALAMSAGRMRRRGKRSSQPGWRARQRRRGWRRAAGRDRDQLAPHAAGGRAVRAM